MWAPILIKKQTNANNSWKDLHLPWDLRMPQRAGRTCTCLGTDGCLGAQGGDVQVQEAPPHRGGEGAAESAAKPLPTRRGMPSSAQVRLPLPIRRPPARGLLQLLARGLRALLVLADAGWRVAGARWLIAAAGTTWPPSHGSADVLVQPRPRFSPPLHATLTACKRLSIRDGKS